MDRNTFSAGNLGGAQLAGEVAVRFQQLNSTNFACHFVLGVIA
jgi:hypothetical protein